MLERAVRTARAASLSPVVVVLGARSLQVQAGCTLGDAMVIVNEEWAEGMGGSVRLGIEALGSLSEKIDGVVLMTCDQPAVTAEHLRLLIRGTEIRASRYAGRIGVPAYFPARSFDALMRLEGDAGARHLLSDAGYVNLADGELDVDTVEELERARKLFGT